MRVATLLVLVTAILASCDPPEQQASGGTGEEAGTEVHIELPRYAQIGPAEVTLPSGDTVQEEARVSVSRP